MAAYTDINDIPDFRYNMIMADPPWRFETYSEAGNKKGPDKQYRTMTLDEIKALPIGHKASGSCILWLWCTHPMLEQQFSVARAWGFNPVTTGVWRKITKNGKMRWGTGYKLRSVSEPFIIATMGDISTPRDIPSCFDGLAREHSRKPDDGYTLAEHMISLYEKPWLLDAFSREERQGWDAFGDEVGKFNNCENEITESE